MEIPKLILPDWTNERGIHILAGIERVAYKLPWEKNWSVKVSRCSQCGRCCLKVNCPYLKKEIGNNDKWICSLGRERPYKCCISNPRNISECTIKFEEVI